MTIVSSKWSGNTNPRIQSGFATFYIGSMPPFLLHLQSFQEYQELCNFIDYAVREGEQRLADSLKLEISSAIDRKCLEY